MAIVTSVLTLEIPGWSSPLSAQNFAASRYSISIRADLPIEKSVSTGNRGLLTCRRRPREHRPRFVNSGLLSGHLMTVLPKVL